LHSHSVQVSEKAYAKCLKFSSGEFNTTTEHIGKSMYAVHFTEDFARLGWWGYNMNFMEAVDD